jgi:hypothetical protein
VLTPGDLALGLRNLPRNPAPSRARELLGNRVRRRARKLPPDRDQNQLQGRKRLKKKKKKRGRKKKIRMMLIIMMMRVRILAILTLHW